MKKEKKARTDSMVENTDFPVVGIGASAGGLEPIKIILENLPENTGSAYIVVQHLAATQESMLRNILSRYTKMDVHQVENKMHIEPNKVYVIPSGKIMTISQGVLNLESKKIQQKTINIFFKSLAQDRKHRAIGVILSGTGTDGTEGLKSIKTEGGITFIQDPKTADYPDMARSAISAETADYILSPQEIAKELVNMANHPEMVQRNLTKAPTENEDLNDNQKIFGFLKKEFDVNFTDYKKPTINRRIARRMVLNDIKDKSEYVEYLRTHKQELAQLFDDLLISVTGFFREPETFKLLKEKILPEILKKKHPKNQYAFGFLAAQQEKRFIQ